MMRKLIGGLLAIIGLLWSVLGILMILVQLKNWRRFDYAYSDWKLIWPMVLLFIVVGAVVCIIGICLYSEIQSKELPPQTHRYRSAFKLKMVKFLEVFFFASGAFLLISYILLPNERVEDIRYFGIMMICAFLFALFWAFYWRHISIEISPDGMRLFRRKREYAFYPLDLPFYSSVTKMRWNAIHIGTEREFCIPIEGNNDKRIPCWGITGRDFLKLVNDIDKFRQGGLFEQLENFTLPRNRLLAKKRRYSIAIMMIILVLGSIIMGLLFLDDWQSTDVYVNSTLIAIVLSGSVLLISIQWGSYLRLARSMAKHVVLTDFGIRMDEQTFPVNRLKRMTMAPSAYNRMASGMSNRRIVLRTTTEYIEYQLGSILGSLEDQEDDDYEKLFSTIRYWCKEKNIPFEEKLE